jgi:Cu(I)/Ag(I) efflux system membrane protein CusA/SilA
MKRIAAPMVGGILTSLVMELTLFPAIFYAIKKRQFNTISKFNDVKGEIK